MFTTAQKTTIKANIVGNSDLLTEYNNGNLQALADLYNALASPDYWSWRTNVTRAEIYGDISPDVSTWNWTTYKNQGATEQNAWVQMFMGDQADFSKANLRAGVAAIFTGSQAATDQKNHVMATGRRKSTRLEKLLAVATVGGVGTRGSTANPDTFAKEGISPYTDFIGVQSW